MTGNYHQSGGIALPGEAAIGQKIQPWADIAADLGSPDNVAQVLAAVPLAVIIIDRQGTIRAFSKMAEELFGYRLDEIIGRNIRVLTPPAIADQHDGFLEQHRNTGENRIIGSNRIEMARHRAGHHFPVELRVTELRIGGERGYIGFLRGIGGTDLQNRDARSMLADLAQASRVSAMGALATSIAHELNQPLTNIANYTKGLCNLVAREDEFRGRDEVIRILEECSSQAIRAGQLIHRLRDFVRGGVPESGPNLVPDLIRDATALAMINGFKRSIHLVYDLESGLPPVEVDHLQAQQVLFNLLRNAFEAVDITDGDHRHDILIGARLLDCGFVEMRVEDDGPGIDPAIAGSLFDSFVTTKGGGMGVGLAICRQIVEAYGGRIWADRSEALGGAAFHFTLPISHAPGGEAS